MLSTYNPVTSNTSFAKFKGLTTWVTKLFSSPMSCSIGPNPFVETSKNVVAAKPSMADRPKFSSVFAIKVCSSSLSSSFDDDTLATLPLLLLTTLSNLIFLLCLLTNEREEKRDDDDDDEGTCKENATIVVVVKGYRMLLLMMMMMINALIIKRRCSFIPQTKHFFSFRGSRLFSFFRLFPFI
jgi:hypothetical protein